MNILYFCQIKLLNLIRPRNLRGHYKDPTDNFQSIILINPIALDLYQILIYIDGIQYIYPFWKQQLISINFARFYSDKFTFYAQSSDSQENRKAFIFLILINNLPSTEKRNSSGISPVSGKPCGLIFHLRNEAVQSVSPQQWIKPYLWNRPDTSDG